MTDSDLSADSDLSSATRHDDPDAAIEALILLYHRSVANLRGALNAFLADRTPPDPALRMARAFCYPDLRIRYDPPGPAPRISRAFGVVTEAGLYASTITRPDFFRNYLREQLVFLARDFGVRFEVGLSDVEIPYPYVLDGAVDLEAGAVSSAELAYFFPFPRLSVLDDSGDQIRADGTRPLGQFDALRTDFSLQRIKHYTGTAFDHVQQFVLFTNYHRYVDAFVEWGAAEVQAGRAEGLSCPGGIIVRADTPDPVTLVANGPWRKHQMPGYHLLREGREGISLINIGVGPSNAKNMTDHLAVLRPDCWIMVGHCGGLRHSQKIGDYALAHAYLRDDHVLDAVLPADMPIPPIAEVQVALQQAAAEVTGESRDALKARLRTGTVVTTDDRNWELSYAAQARRLSLSRAIAIDMESATIAANGYRHRVPYGTLLCVSDKPLHGEIKLPGQANRFYERAIGEHLQIGIVALELLRSQGPALHSRKLRAFDEPPFR